MTDLKRISKIGVVHLMLIIGLVGVSEARINLGECVYLEGFGRYTLGVHTGGENPYNEAYGQKHRNDFNLARFMMQGELTYKPSSDFKAFAKVRFISDHTQDIDNHLLDYNAFPLDVPQGDWTMLKVSNNHVRAEIWELYSDIQIGDLWLRLGKQQISWGEMIGVRITDQVNALETNWHLTMEPEEYENIRIPNWMIRGVYQFGALETLKIRDFYLEGFLNPGDVTPGQGPVPGSPFNQQGPFPGFFRIDNKDKRGEMEFGFRTGGMFSEYYFTLIYMKVFWDSYKLQTVGFAPDPISGRPFFIRQGDPTLYDVLIDARYPRVDLFGLTFNYEVPPPFGIVATLEASWIPEAPWGKAGAAFPAIEKQGEFTYSLALNRPTALFPRMIMGTPIPLTALTLQFVQYIREGDNRAILGPGNSKLEHTQELIVTNIKQDLLYRTITVGFQTIIDLDDAYQLKPSITYRHSDDWYIDLVGVFFSGAQKQAGRLGYLDYADEVFARFTYQF